MFYRLNLKLRRILQSFFYRLFCSFAHLIFSIFLKVNVIGRENIPKNGTFILSANHQNFFDGFLLANAIGLSLRVSFIIAKRALRRSRFFYFLAWLIGQELIGDEAEEYPKALKRLTRVMLHGRIVGIFPEGDVSNHKIPRKFKPGVAKLSLDSKARVVPVYIDGTYMLRYFDYWLKRPEIKIKIGKPLELYMYASAFGNNLEEMAQVLRNKVIELKEQDEKFKEIKPLLIRQPLSLENSGMIKQVEKPPVRS